MPVAGESGCSRGWKYWVLGGLVPFVGLCITGLPLACGPSIQPIHEGGVRFEHCYRLDLDPKIAPSHRHACWKQWLEVYSYGQSRDRLEYSRRRVRDLEAGDPNPPQLHLDQIEEREARQFYMATPAPTSVHAPPPPVATPTEATEPLAPGDACVVSCRTARNACLNRCEQQPGATPPTPANSASATPPAPKAGSAPTAPAASGASAAKPEESAVGECDCEREYKMCGARCFE